MGTLFGAIDTKRLTFVYTLVKPIHGKLMIIDANSPILGKLHFHYAPCLYQKQPRLLRAPATTIKSSTAPYYVGNGTRQHQGSQAKSLKFTYTFQRICSQKMGTREARPHLPRVWWRLASHQISRFVASEILHYVVSALTTVKPCHVCVSLASVWYTTPNVAFTTLFRAELKSNLSNGIRPILAIYLRFTARKGPELRPGLAFLAPKLTRQSGTPYASVDAGLGRTGRPTSRSVWHFRLTILRSIN